VVLTAFFLGIAGASATSYNVSGNVGRYQPGLMPCQAIIISAPGGALYPVRVSTHMPNPQSAGGLATQWMWWKPDLYRWGGSSWQLFQRGEWMYAVTTPYGLRDGYFTVYTTDPQIRPGTSETATEYRWETTTRGYYGIWNNLYWVGSGNVGGGSLGFWSPAAEELTLTALNRNWCGVGV
jgi:hypothetical protein